MSAVVTIVDGWPKLDMGRCVHPIVLWKKSEASPAQFDAAGPVLEWQPVLTAMASIETMRGTEMVKAGMDTSRRIAEIVFWWQDGVDSDMQVTDEYGITYIVQSADDVGNRRVVARLNCIEVRQ